MVSKKYLIGEMKENFVGRKLPTNGEVMSVFLYQHDVNKLTLKKSASAAKLPIKWILDNLRITKML